MILQATVARKPDHRGDHEAAVKPSRRECRCETGEPVVELLVCFFIFAREAMGALGPRHSLCPRCFEDIVWCNSSGASRRENEESYSGDHIRRSTVIASVSEAIQSCFVTLGLRRTRSRK